MYMNKSVKLFHTVKETSFSKHFLVKGNVYCKKNQSLHCSKKDVLAFCCLSIQEWKGDLLFILLFLNCCILKNHVHISSLQKNTEGAKHSCFL